MGVRSVRDVTGGNKVSRDQSLVECCEGQGGGVTRSGIRPFTAASLRVTVDEALVTIRDAIQGYLAVH